MSGTVLLTQLGGSQSLVGKLLKASIKLPSK